MGIVHKKKQMVNWGCGLSESMWLSRCFNERLGPAPQKGVWETVFLTWNPGHPQRGLYFSPGALECFDSWGASAVRRMQGPNRLRIAVICWQLQFWAKTNSFFSCLLPMTPFFIFGARLLKGLIERQVTRPSAQLRAPSNMMSRERPILSCKRSSIIDIEWQWHLVCRLRLLRSAPSSADLQRPWLTCFQRRECMNQSVYEHLISVDSVCIRHQVPQGRNTHNRLDKGGSSLRRKGCFFSNLQVLGCRNTCSECLRADGKDVIGGLVDRLDSCSFTATKIVLGLVSVLFSVVASVVKAALTCSFYMSFMQNWDVGWLDWLQACPPLWPEARGLLTWNCRKNWKCLLLALHAVESMAISK